MLLGLLFFFYMDYKIYMRKVGIERVFPDFLQLTSANIRAGMAIDQALWHAIRPNFGVLAKEMEDVEKDKIEINGLEEADEFKDFVKVFETPYFFKRETAVPSFEKKRLRNKFEVKIITETLADIFAKQGNYFDATSK